MDILERITKPFKQTPGKGPAKKFGPKLLLLLCLGIGLISFNALFNPGGKSTVSNEDTYQAQSNDVSGDRALLEELTAMLEQIRGVSNVSIIITLEDSGRQEIASDREQNRRQTVEGDSGGGSREITEDTLRESHVILRDAQGREIPLIVQENQPRYRGVVVVASGVEQPLVKAQVVEALSAVLDLPYHRISVLPRGGEGR